MPIYNQLVAITLLNELKIKGIYKFGSEDMLEKMGDFFDNRLDIYEKHQLTCINSASEFYHFTAKCLPIKSGVTILDLGCGTGLELDSYFKINPEAKVTGIDLAAGMLSLLRNKFKDKDIKLILGSYFDVPFGVKCFDAAVSVESLHHFTKKEKILLYKKLHDALKNNGYFILTDYFVMSDEEENFFKNELIRLKNVQGIKNDDFYHYDTPLTINHEIEALKEAGFSSVEVLENWASTFTIKAIY